MLKTKIIKKYAVLGTICLSLTLSACGASQPPAPSEAPLPDTLPTEQSEFRTVDEMDMDGTTITLEKPKEFDNPGTDATTPPETPVETPSPTETQNADKTEPTPTPEPTEPAEVKPFKLTQEEQALYDSYVGKKDVNVFKNANPINIAKAFINLGINNETELEYKMYSTSNMDASYEDYMESVESATISTEQRQYFADLLFGALDAGKVVDVNGENCYIEFTTQSPDPEVAKISLIKDENGVWRIDFYNFLSQ